MNDVNGWLPDASVLLELRKPSANPGVASWSNAQPRESFFLSAATVAAIRHHTASLCDAALRTEIEIWLGQTLKPWFAGRILPLTEEIVLEWLRIRDRRGLSGAAGRHPDLLLAATARVHGLTVCTMDDRACVLAGVSVFNPWKASGP